MNQSVLEKLKFDEKGLIPAVVQDARTGAVLTVAYMNRESLSISMEEGRSCFYSRSRQCLWRKGVQSGNVQHIVSITADCDYDALVVKVIKEGPACHLGTDSCFTNLLLQKEPEQAPFRLEQLYELLCGRKTQRKEGSYTSYLFEKGPEKILKKIGEECTEVVIAAMKDSREETIFEISDLAYHVLVLMVEKGITVDDIKAELQSRHVVDHKVKQETMQ